MKMQNASGMLLVLTRSRTGGDAHPEARGGGKVCVVAQEAVLRCSDLKGRAQGQHSEAFGRAELLSAPTPDLNAFVTVTRLTLSLLC